MTDSPKPKQSSPNRVVMDAAEARRKYDLGPSKEVLEKIRQNQIDRARAYERLKDTLIG